MSKAKSKIAEKMVSVRINAASKSAAKELLKKANNKELGRSIKFNELVALALNLVSDEHLKMLQNASLSNADRQEQLRQRYIETRGPITKDAFIGFTFSAEYPQFLAEQNILRESRETERAKVA